MARKYKCANCTYTTNSKSIMQEHIYNHSSIIPYSCGYCGSSMSTKQGISVHTKREHPGMPTHALKQTIDNEQEYYTVFHEAQVIHRLSKELPNSTKPKTSSVKVVGPSSKSLPDQAVITDRLSSQNYSANKLSFKDSLSEAEKFMKSSNVDHFKCRLCTFNSSSEIEITNHCVSKHNRKSVFACEYCEETFEKLEGIYKHCTIKHSLQKVVLHELLNYTKVSDSDKHSEFDNTVNSDNVQFNSSLKHYQSKEDSDTYMSIQESGLNTGQESSEQELEFNSQQSPRSPNARKSTHKSPLSGEFNSQFLLESPVSQHQINEDHSSLSFTHSFMSDEAANSSPFSIFNLKTKNRLLRESHRKVNPQTPCNALDLSKNSKLVDVSSSQIQSNNSSKTTDYMCEEISSTSDGAGLVSKEIPKRLSSQSSLYNSENISSDIINSLPTPSTPVFYKCVTCNAFTDSLTNMIEHISAVHKKEFWYACPHCDYCSKINLLHHMIREHPNEDPSRFTLVNEESYFETISGKISQSDISTPEANHHQLNLQNLVDQNTLQTNFSIEHQKVDQMNSNFHNHVQIGNAIFIQTNNEACNSVTYSQPDIVPSVSVNNWKSGQVPSVNLQHTLTQPPNNQILSQNTTHLNYNLSQKPPNDPKVSHLKTSNELDQHSEMLSLDPAVKDSYSSPKESFSIFNIKPNLVRPCYSNSFSSQMNHNNQDLSRFSAEQSQYFNSGISKEQMTTSSAPSAINPVFAEQGLTSLKSASLKHLSCPYCSNEQPDTDSLHNHILEHAPNIQWTCPYCPISSRMTKENVAMHITECHTGCRIVFIPFGVLP